MLLRGRVSTGCIRSRSLVFSAAFSAAVFSTAGLLLLGCSGIVLPTPSGASGSAASGSSVTSGSTSGSPTPGATGSASPVFGAGGLSGGGSSAGSSGTGSSAGSSGFSGAPNPCADLGLPATAEICPGGMSVAGTYADVNGECVLQFSCPVVPTVPPPLSGACAEGAPCSPGSGCGSGSAAPAACSLSCFCGANATLQCSTMCTTVAKPPVGCVQGAACGPGATCSTGSGADAGVPGPCETSCRCPSNGKFECANVCVDGGAVAIDAAPPNPCLGLAVPDLCEVCSDGAIACAHYVDVGGTCELATCPPVSVFDGGDVDSGDGVDAAALACAALVAPAFCQRCIPDGSTDCAHYVPSPTGCTLQICDAPYPPH